MTSQAWQVKARSTELEEDGAGGQSSLACSARHDDDDDDDDNDVSWFTERHFGNSVRFQTSNGSSTVAVDVTTIDTKKMDVFGTATMIQDNNFADSLLPT